MSQPVPVAPAPPERVIYADMLRVLSAFAVILLHIAAYDWYKTPVNTLSWQAYNFYDGLARFCVPVFIMLSGMFYLDPDKSFSLKKLWTRAIPRLVSALILWGVFYKFINAYYTAQRLRQAFVVNLGTFVEYFRQILAGDAWYHLWFLYMLLGLYVFVPVLRSYVKNASRKNIEYLLLACLGLSGVVSLFNAFAPGGWMIGAYTQATGGWLFGVTLPMVGYGAFFIAGYYFKRYDLSKKMFIALMVLGGLGMLFTTVGSGLLSLKAHTQRVFYDEYFISNTLFTYALFALFKKLFEKRDFDLWFRDAIQWMSGCTFGVYLVHVAFIMLVTGAFKLTPSSFNAVLSVPVLSLMVFALSLFAVGWFRKLLPWAAKWIM